MLHLFPLNLPWATQKAGLNYLEELLDSSTNKI